MLFPPLFFAAYLPLPGSAADSSTTRFCLETDFQLTISPSANRDSKLTIRQQTPFTAYYIVLMPSTGNFRPISKTITHHLFRLITSEILNQNMLDAYLYRLLE